MKMGFKNNNKSTLLMKSQHHTQGITVQKKRTGGMALVVYSVCGIHYQRVSCDNDYQQKEDVLLVLTSHTKSS
jgi:hypothetical protein